MTRRLPEFLPFREHCIGEIAQMFGYVDPMDRERGLLTLGGMPVEKGELVCICSAPVSLWGFSWVEEVGNSSHGEYCLRAVGTDQLCDWTNISVPPFRRDRYEGRDDLAWYPNQYEFWIKLQKAYLRAGIDRHDFSLLYPKFEDKAADVRFRCHILRGEQAPPAPLRVEGFATVTSKLLTEMIKQAQEGWDN